MLLQLILYARQKDFDFMCQKLSQVYQRKDKFHPRNSRSQINSLALKFNPRRLTY